MIASHTLDALVELEFAEFTDTGWSWLELGRRLFSDGVRSALTRLINQEALSPEQKQIVHDLGFDPATGKARLCPHHHHLMTHGECWECTDKGYHGKYEYFEDQAARWSK